MRKLILVKHAKPLVDETKPSRQWKLSDQGRMSCQALSRAIKAHSPKIILTSDEPKAMETGALVGKDLGIPSRQAPDLHEHDRNNVPMMDSREFISTMALFFKERRQLVLGLETAEEALARFENAVEEVMRSESDGNIAIVTHGTVLALFGEAHQGGDGFSLWRRLGLPSLMVFSFPELQVLDAVERI
jgi:broad specificity phosphatase PhoE